MKLILEQQTENETTRVEFEVNDDLDVFDLYRYLERFALAIGFMPGSIEDAIVERSIDINHD